MVHNAEGIGLLTVIVRGSKSTSTATLCGSLAVRLTKSIAVCALGTDTARQAVKDMLYRLVLSLSRPEQRLYPTSVEAYLYSTRQAQGFNLDCQRCLEAGFGTSQCRVAKPITGLLKS